MPASIYWSLPAWLAPDRIQQNWWGLDLVTRPVDEPVALGDVKLHARADGTYDDAYLAGLAVVARRHIERRTNRALLPQTWDFWMQTWPLDRIFLPRAPLTSVSWLKYTDIGEQQNTVDPSVYDVCTTGDPGSVVRQFGQIWPPDPLSPSRPINVRFTAGYARFAGVVSVDNTGLAVTWSSGDKFDPTWPARQPFTIGDLSYPIASVTDDQHLTLALAAPQGSGPYTLNLVPEEIKLAIKYMVAHWYANREPVAVGRGITSVEIANTVDSLIGSYRINVMGFGQNRAQSAPLWA